MNLHPIISISVPKKSLFNIPKTAMITLLCLFMLCSCQIDENNDSKSNSKENYGIVLSFDDFYSSWWENIDLFTSNNIQAVFFLSYNYNDKDISDLFDLSKQLIENGHEIGWHTKTHNNLTKTDKDNLHTEISEIKEIFYVNTGYNISSFAFPFGLYSDPAINEATRSYSLVRGFSRVPEFYSLKEIRRREVVSSMSIDNKFYITDEEFCKKIDALIWDCHKQQKYIFITSHSIGDSEWGIKKNRLQYLFDKANESGIKFFTYKQLLSM